LSFSCARSSFPRQGVSPPTAPLGTYMYSTVLDVRSTLAKVGPGRSSIFNQCRYMYSLLQHYDSRLAFTSNTARPRLGRRAGSGVGSQTEPTNLGVPNRSSSPMRSHLLTHIRQSTPSDGRAGWPAFSLPSSSMAHPPHPNSTEPAITTSGCHCRRPIRCATAQTAYNFMAPSQRTLHHHLRPLSPKR